MGLFSYSFSRTVLFRRCCVLCGLVESGAWEGRRGGGGGANGRSEVEAGKTVVGSSRRRAFFWFSVCSLSPFPLSFSLSLYLCFGFEVKLFASLVPELERAVAGVLRQVFFFKKKKKKKNCFQTSVVIDRRRAINHGLFALFFLQSNTLPYLDLELAAQEMLKPGKARSHEDQQGSSDDEEAGSGAPARQRLHAQKKQKRRERRNRS